MTRRGFSLVELLVCVAVIATLAGLLLPALAGARGAGRSAACLSNQRQLVAAWTLYAGVWRDRAMPAADLSNPAVPVYWWGAIRDTGRAIDHAAGLLMPHLDTTLAARSVLECPEQPWGTYRAQPTALAVPQPTSTYGYNGYYLAPAATPGWSSQIFAQPWQRLGDIPTPSALFVFADAMLPGSPMRNSALLDPPWLLAGGQWFHNPSPTTAFRHPTGPLGAAATARADGSASALAAQPGWLTHPSQRIGSAGDHSLPTSIGPHYVQKWNRSP